MKILVDADACPTAIKDILCRAANRTQIYTTFVANHYISLQTSTYISFLRVSSGFDIADNKIIQLSEQEDLVITSDILLADFVIERGAKVISQYGELYTKDNIKARLTMRNFMETLRGSGINIGGPEKFSKANHLKFANQLDIILNTYIKNKKN